MSYFADGFVLGQALGELSNAKDKRITHEEMIERIAAQRDALHQLLKELVPDPKQREKLTPRYQELTRLNCEKRGVKPTF